ncbi:MAG: molybdopterin-guanine dinucleotide biosynthesis protein B [Thermodesulfobacteriota bacterium]
MGDNSTPVVLIVGRSDAGKTTLIEKLLPQLKRLGLKVGTIKHDVHGFEIDRPGKDSWRHKRAGASATIISSPTQMALIRDSDHDQTLDELLGHFQGLDLVLTEGYKREKRPKIEVFRPEVHSEPLCRDDRNLIALVSDAALDLGVPRFGLEEVEKLAAFLKDRIANHWCPAGCGNPDRENDQARNTAE